MSFTHPTSRRPGRPPARRLPRAGRGALPAAALACLLLLSGCGESHQAPRDWIADHYRRQSFDVYLDPEHRPLAVADAIENQTPAKDRVVAGDLVLLRYEEDIVSVEPDGRRGSRIEIEDYESGMRRHSAQVGHRWPHHQHRSGGDFRGGGPGSGK